jgi:hypothetical protein
MCRELHERFMPERVPTRNKINHAQSLFFVRFIHKVIHSSVRFAIGKNHGASRILRPFHSEKSDRAWGCGKQWHLMVGIFNAYYV